ncbi:hypothetical protein HPB47_016021 [Ixodes persulcatus]|uniref:Uncharacterized protein n=1 Tax=Ixodes persulcatus TaxID=34615 RepID=A0AC60QS06_IXOPE|nr:hypothetical protein HPB47_016021 [Ixodes persulcatus]
MKTNEFFLDAEKAYLWAYKFDCRTYEAFSPLNGLLVGIAQNPQGKKKMSLMLQEMGTPLATGLISMLSKCQNIHLTPFVLNTSRMYDQVAAFGTFPVDDVRCDELEGLSSSPRDLLATQQQQLAAQFQLLAAQVHLSPGVYMPVFKFNSVLLAETDFKCVIKESRSL